MFIELDSPLAALERLINEPKLDLDQDFQRIWDCYSLSSSLHASPQKKPVKVENVRHSRVRTFALDLVRIRYFELISQR